MNNLRSKIADWIAPERARELKEAHLSIQMDVNRRVADVINKLDPFEPAYRKYHVIFSSEYEHPEDKLSDRSQFEFFQWAHYLTRDPNFRHLMDFIRNTQGNATVRAAKTDQEWFVGRAMLFLIASLIKEVNRLSTRFEDIISKRDGDAKFNRFIPVEE